MEARSGGECEWEGDREGPSQPQLALGSQGKAARLKNLGSGSAPARARAHRASTSRSKCGSGRRYLLDGRCARHEGHSFRFFRIDSAMQAPQKRCMHTMEACACRMMPKQMWHRVSA